MKKTPRTTKQKSIQTKPKGFGEALIIGFLFGFFLFVLINIFYSQQVSPLYVGLVNRDRASTVLFLRHVRTLPLFSSLLADQSELFGEDLSNEVYFEKTAREKQMNELKQYLAANPKSPHVLYALSLLYRQEGEEQVANQYLQEAQRVDPSLL